MPDIDMLWMRCDSTFFGCDAAFLSGSRPWMAFDSSFFACELFLVASDNLFFTIDTLWVGCDSTFLGCDAAFLSCDRLWIGFDRSFFACDMPWSACDCSFSGIDTLWSVCDNPFSAIDMLWSGFDSSFSAIDTLWNGCDASFFALSSFWEAFAPSEGWRERTFDDRKIVGCAEAIICLYLYGNVAPKVGNDFLLAKKSRKKVNILIPMLGAASPWAGTPGGILGVKGA